MALSSIYADPPTADIQPGFIPSINLALNTTISGCHNIIHIFGNEHRTLEFLAQTTIISGFQNLCMLYLAFEDTCIRMLEYLNIVFGTEHKYIKMPEYLKLIYSVESKTKIYQMLGLLDIS